MEDSDQEDSTKPSSSKKRKRSSSGVKREASSSSSKGEGSSKDKTNGSSNSSGNKDKDEVERLKKYVNACGVKKPYKNWFPEQGATTPKLQVKALRSLLSELGMGEGRLSMGKAAEIKQKREMQKELQAIGAAIGSDEEELKKGRTTRNRKIRRNEDDDSDEEDGFEGEEKGSSPGGRRSPRQIKKKVSSSDRPSLEEHPADTTIYSSPSPFSEALPTIWPTLPMTSIPTKGCPWQVIPHRYLSHVVINDLERLLDSYVVPCP